MDIIRRNNVNVYGKGKQPMLFAHGFGCDQHMWRYITPAFEKDYQIILFDHIGFGKSDSSAYTTDKYATLQAYADDMLEICEALQLQQIIFVGHSVSAVIGILAAIKNPELFEKMVLLSPSPCYLNDDNYIGGMTREDVEGLLEVLDSDYLKWAENITPVIMGNADRPELTHELHESFCQSDQQIAKEFARLTFLSDNRSDLEHLHTETLILQCSQDMIAPVEVGHYMHQKITGSSLVEMKATGHCPNLSAPEETIAAIKDFLANPVL